MADPVAEAARVRKILETAAAEDRVWLSSCRKYEATPSRNELVQQLTSRKKKADLGAFLKARMMFLEDEHRQKVPPPLSLFAIWAISDKIEQNVIIGRYEKWWEDNAIPTLKDLEKEDEQLLREYWARLHDETEKFTVSTAIHEIILHWQDEGLSNIPRKYLSGTKLLADWKERASHPPVIPAAAQVVQPIPDAAIRATIPAVAPTLVVPATENASMLEQFCKTAFCAAPVVPEPAQNIDSDLECRARKYLREAFLSDAIAKEALSVAALARDEATQLILAAKLSPAKLKYSASIPNRPPKQITVRTYKPEAPNTRVVIDISSVSKYVVV